MNDTDKKTINSDAPRRRATTAEDISGGSGHVDAKEMGQALIEVQKEIPPIKKTANNPFFKSSYAPLNEILDTVKPILNKHGFALLQFVGMDIATKIPLIKTVLCHAPTRGEIIGELPILMRAGKGGEFGTHEQAAAITMGKRIALVAMLALSLEEDLDGHTKTENPPVEIYRGSDLAKKTRLLAYLKTLGYEGAVTIPITLKMEGQLMQPDIVSAVIERLKGAKE